MSTKATTLDKPGISSPVAKYLARLSPLSGAASNIDALDGLRGVAVLLVMIYHAIWEIQHNSHTSPSFAAFLDRTSPVWDFGATGVHLFFVLSGFLLFLPYARVLVTQGNIPSTRKFYTRRALRILPAYWASLIVMVLVLEPQYLQPEKWPDIGLHLALLHNATSTTRVSINAPFWTIGVESHFYLLLPLMSILLITVARRLNTRWTVAGLGALVFSSSAFALFLVVAKRITPGLLPYLNILEVFSWLTVFALGMCSSIIYVQVSEQKNSVISLAYVRKLCRVAGPLGIGIIGIYAATKQSGLPIDQAEWLFRNLVLGFAYSLILLCTLLGLDSWKRALASRAMRFLGLISYSLYIWHALIYGMFVVPFAAGFASDILTCVLTGLFTVTVVIPFCLAFYHAFEKPFFKARSVAH